MFKVLFIKNNIIIIEKNFFNYEDSIAHALYLTHFLTKNIKIEVYEKSNIYRLIKKFEIKH